MTIEEKLDQIIMYLRTIDEKLPSPLFGISEAKGRTGEKSLGPTAAQLKNKRAVDLANRMDRQIFLRYIRSNINKIIEKQNATPMWTLEFVPQSLDWFPKFRNPNAGFYQELKQHTILYAKRVSYEGRLLIVKLRK